MNMIIAAITSIVILSIGGFMLYQITKNHQANQLIIEECFNSFDSERTVVIKKEGFWSLTTCEHK